MKEHKLVWPPCELRTFESTDELARSAVLDWLELLQVLEMAGREPTVALCGGRTALHLFDAAAKVFSNHLDTIRKVHFFWGDERCVPPNHPESNYGAAAARLLKPLGIPELNIHRIPGEFDPATAAATAAKGITRWTESGAGEAHLFDLVILGMGEDGHVASLFPGEPAEAMESPDICRAVKASKPPPHRVTVGYGVLSKADNVWVLASGKGKVDALKTSLGEPARTPLGRVLVSRASTRIYTDLSPADGLGPLFEEGG